MTPLPIDCGQGRQTQLPAWHTTNKSGPGTADLTKYKVFAPNGDLMQAATAQSRSDSAEATSLSLSRDGAVYMTVSSDKGVAVRFDADAFQFAFSWGLFDHARSFADIIEVCLGKQPAMGCRLYRDPEIGEKCLVFDAVIVDDPTPAVRQLEDFRRRAAKAVPAPVRRLLRLFYHVS